ncbi:MAG: sulfatase [Planctomycetota bacterium]
MTAPHTDARFARRGLEAVLDAALLGCVAVAVGRLGALGPKDLGPALPPAVALAAALPFALRHLDRTPPPVGGLAPHWTATLRRRAAWTVLATTLCLALVELSNVPVQRARGPALAAALAVWVNTAGALLSRALLARRPTQAAPASTDAARTTRRLWIGGAAATAAIVIGALLWRARAADVAPAPLTAGARYNLVLVTVDTLRADALGCYGQTRDTSPNLDRLASEGARFAHVTAQAPHTHGSMASLLTSKYPLAHRSVNGQPALAAAHETLAEHFASLGYRTAGFLDNPWLTPEFGFTRGYERFEPRSTNDAALPWLQAHASERFFLHVHHLHPHGPYTPERPWIEAWSPGYKGPWERVEGELLERAERPGVAEAAGVDLDRFLALYHSEVRRVDQEIGELLQALADAGRSEDTLVVFAADHGEEFLDHGALHHSHTLYEELVHVPLIVRLPGRVRPATVVEGGVSLVDVAPTVLELMGLPPLSEAQGRSFGGALNGEPLAPRIGFAQRYNRIGRHLVSANDGRWKLHVLLARTGPLPLVDWSAAQPPERDWLASNRYALYDLARDPGERRDLANAHPEVVARLSEAIVAWRAACDPGTPFGPGATDQSLQVSREARARLTALGYAGDIDGER